VVLPTPAGGAIIDTLDKPPSPVREIITLGELDRELARAEAAFGVSDDEGRKVLDGFAYVCPEPFPSDPYSEEYREAQMRVYAQVSGRATYDARVEEHSEFDLAAAKRRPFPYLTSSAETVGTHLMAYGFMIRNLGVPPASRLVEFGPGWGNLTLHLAQMGHRVTAVEIEPAFCELIRDRAARAGVDLEIVQRDMLAFRPEAPYAAAIFFGTFHHCVDHLRMLRNLADIVTPDGVLVFGDEPVGSYPHPWALRLDGLSVWSTRRHGWLELGFDTSYFLRTLLLFGWLPRRRSLDKCDPADLIVARRSQGLYEPHLVTLPPDEDRTWAAAGADYRFVARRSVMTCRNDVPVGAVEFSLSNLGPATGQVTLGGGRVAQTVSVPPGMQRQRFTMAVENWTGQVAIEAAPDTPPNTIAVHHVRTGAGVGAIAGV
jgi:SAM-dependent methyltransferase